MRKTTLYRLAGLGIIVILAAWYGFLLHYENLLRARTKALSETPIEITLPVPARSTFSGAYLAARFAQSTQDWAGAAQHLNKAVDMGPADPPLLRHAMLLSMGSGHVAEGFALAKRLEDKGGQDFLPPLLLAVQALMAHDLGPAKTYLQIARARGASAPDALLPLLNTRSRAAQAALQIAQNLWKNDQPEGARVFAHIARSLDPAVREADILLGTLHAAYGRYDTALTYFESVPAGTALYPDARRAAAEILQDTNRGTEALGLLKEIRNPDADTLLQMGELQREAKDYTAALSSYDKAQKLLGTPLPKDYWFVPYMRAMALDAADRWPEAEAALRATLALKPDDAGALNYLAYSWVDKGQNLKEATQMLKRALAARPGDYAIIDSMGWAQYRQGAWSEAVRYLEEAAGLAPYDDVVAEHLGDAYWRAGRLREARFQWTRAGNYTKDKTLGARVADKVKGGLPEDPNALHHAAR